MPAPGVASFWKKHRSDRKKSPLKWEMDQMIKKKQHVGYADSGADPAENESSKTWAIRDRAYHGLLLRSRSSRPLLGPGTCFACFAGFRVAGSLRRWAAAAGRSPSKRGRQEDGGKKSRSRSKSPTKSGKGKKLAAGAKKRAAQISTHCQDHKAQFLPLGGLGPGGSCTPILA